MMNFALALMGQPTPGPLSLEDELILPLEDELILPLEDELILPLEDELILPLEDELIRPILGGEKEKSVYW